ncbi:MAG: hypothetical protein H6733_13680 [Alphaproteobacteria bacterium]|nr:hypothetical protein [Alphaproteobacteria bacterium]
MASVLCLSMLVAPVSPAAPSPAVFEIVEQPASGDPVVVGHVWVEQNSSTQACTEHWTVKKTGSGDASLNGRNVWFRGKTWSAPTSLGAFRTLSSTQLSGATLTTWDNTVNLIVDGACASAGTCDTAFGSGGGSPPPPANKRATRSIAGTPDVKPQIDIGIVVGLTAKGDPYGFSYRSGTTEYWMFDTDDGLRTPQGDGDDYIKFSNLETSERTEAQFKACACDKLKPYSKERYYKVTTSVGTYTP